MYSLHVLYIIIVFFLVYLLFFFFSSIFFLVYLLEERGPQKLFKPCCDCTVFKQSVLSPPADTDALSVLNSKTRTTQLSEINSWLYNENLNQNKIYCVWLALQNFVEVLLSVIYTRITIEIHITAYARWRWTVLFQFICAALLNVEILNHSLTQVGTEL